MRGTKEARELIPPHLVAAVGLAWIFHPPRTYRYDSEFLEDVESLCLVCFGGRRVALSGVFLEDVESLCLVCFGGRRVALSGVFSGGRRVALFGVLWRTSSRSVWCISWRTFESFRLVVD